MARALALLVAVGGLALAVALTLHGIDEVREPFHDFADVTVVWVLVFLATIGGGLLAVGTVQWYGHQAQILRLAGFCALLLAALGVVSFAFLLAPIVLLAMPALSHREGISQRLLRECSRRALCA